MTRALSSNFKTHNTYNSFQANPSSISVVDPKLYSKRFWTFIGRTFIEDRHGGIIIIKIVNLEFSRILEV
jgi:hypothetical protein